MVKSYLVEGGLKFKTVPEEDGPREDIEAKSSSRRSDYETSKVTHVTHSLCAHQRHQGDVVLLALILVHCRHLGVVVSMTT